MFFLLKRDWRTGLLATAVLAMLGLSARQLVPEPPAWGFSLRHAASGFGVAVAVLTSDALLHGVFVVIFRDGYRTLHRELAGVFRAQDTPAIVAGALMAGGGEEIVFRGLSSNWTYLVSAALVFGLLHHIRVRLWPFTLWAILEGLLFAAALYVTSAVFVTMTAHFLHDLAGFFIFRLINRMQARAVRHPP
jgi:membrane protease YdiL (CAAX protease family)